MGKMEGMPPQHLALLMKDKAKYDAGIYASLRGEKIFYIQKGLKKHLKCASFDKK
jgi:hypothetical protein